MDGLTGHPARPMPLPASAWPALADRRPDRPAPSRWAGGQAGRRLCPATRPARKALGENKKTARAIPTGCTGPRGCIFAAHVKKIANRGVIFLSSTFSPRREAASRPPQAAPCRHLPGDARTRQGETAARAYRQPRAHGRGAKHRPTRRMRTRRPPETDPKPQGLWRRGFALSRPGVATGSLTVRTPAAGLLAVGRLPQARGLRRKSWTGTPTLPPIPPSFRPRAPQAAAPRGTCRNHPIQRTTFSPPSPASQTTLLRPMALPRYRA